jgi:hypothetical protein
MSINVVNVGNIPASVYFTNQTNSMVNTIWTPAASTIGGTYVQLGQIPRKMRVSRIERKTQEAGRAILESLHLLDMFNQFVGTNPSNHLPYHNLYHTMCMVINCDEGARYHRLSEHDRRMLALAALFHDYDHSGGSLKDEENIDRALKGLTKAVNTYDPLVRAQLDLPQVYSLIKITKYPYDAEPVTIGEMIIRDADLMQIYEPNVKQLCKQYLGLKSEVEVTLGRKFTRQEYADGQLDWWAKNIHWYSVWAKQKAVDMDLGSLKLRLHDLLAGIGIGKTAAPVIAQPISKVESIMQIKYVRYQSNYDRVICHGSLVNIVTTDGVEEEEIILQTHLAGILTYCDQNDIEIENGQEILNALVLQQGFAA